MYGPNPEWFGEAKDKGASEQDTGGLLLGTAKDDDALI